MPPLPEGLETYQPHDGIVWHNFFRIWLSEIRNLLILHLTCICVQTMYIFSEDIRIASTACEPHTPSLITDGALALCTVVKSPLYEREEPLVRWGKNLVVHIAATRSTAHLVVRGFVL